MIYKIKDFAFWKSANRRFAFWMSAALVILVLVVMLPLAANATDVTLAWDANTEADLIGYKLYRAEKFGNKTVAWNLVATIPAGTETYIDVVEGKKSWAWLLTAYSAEDESFVSNMVELRKGKPSKVDNLRKQ